MFEHVAGKGAVAALIMAVSACAPAPAGDAGGIDAEVVRAFLLDGIAQNRAMDIRFAEAIPDSALAWGPSPDVRNFAQQIAHAADNYWIAGGLGVEAPTFAEGSNREELIAEVTRAYDWLEARARELPAEEFADTVDLFGNETLKWRVFTQAIEHATWTRGQLVPYYHAHGVAVPQVTFY